MGTDQGLYRVVEAAVADASAGAADAVVITPAAPIDVVGFGWITTTALVGTSMVLDLSHRPTAGSDTGRDQQIDIDGTSNDGTMTIAASVGGLHHYKAVDEFEVDVGEQIIVDRSTAIGTSGAGVVYIRYRERAAAGTRFTTNSTEY